MGELEALEAIAALGLFADHIEDGVNQLRTLGVVAFSPVVSSSALSENEVIGAEQLTEWAGADGVHGAGLQIDKNRAWDVLSTSSLIVVHVDSFELQVAVTMVSAGRIDAVLVGDDLPELQTCE